MLYIQQATIFTPHTQLTEAVVLIEQDRIHAVGRPEQVPCPPGAQQIDAQGLLLAPGFIDLQLNGAFGFDFTANPDSIFSVAARLPQYGVTAFLPTIITSPFETITAAQTTLLENSPAHFSGAAPLGLHLEGPFLNPHKRGAHNAAYLRQPAELNEVFDFGDRVAALQPGRARWSPERGVRLVTLAPELPSALNLIQELHAQGVVVSAGHSMATAAEAQAGFNAGLTYGTHIFNAMPPLDHRASGLAGALLADARLTVGIIPDGIHLHPTIVKLVWQAAGPARVNVVTDAMAALGMPPGHYELGDFEVTVDATSARLSDGRLAGSILSLDQALRNLIAYTGCSLSEALSTLTTVPARVLGLPDRGQIAPGYLADLVLLTPELKIAKTIVRGELSYTAH